MAHFVNSSARAVYEAKTNEELFALRTRVEETGARNKAAMRTADGQRVVSIMILGGEFVNVSAAISALNCAREMWKDITQILIERGVA